MNPLAKYGDARIPLLAAYGLDRVPGCDTSDPRFKEPDAAWRTDWFAQRDQLLVHRVKTRLAADRDPTRRALELAKCRQDPAYWLAMYGWIYEPRPREGEDTDKPYIPIAFQVNLLYWIIAHLAEPGKYDGYLSKSRGLGASWIFCAAALWCWLHHPWEIHFVSFKEDKVYQRNDRSSLFGKIEYMLARLPGWMLPEGFDPEAHHLRLNLFNPVTKAAITGESTTTKTTRSGRKTGIIYDEAAFIEKYALVYGTGAGTTDTRFSISTESYEEGDDWERTWHAAKKADPETTWELEWYENPYQDRLWYETEKKRHVANPAYFEVEYERNPEASIGTWMYPEVRHCALTEEHYDPTRTLIIGIDPGQADDTAIGWGQAIKAEGGRAGIRWLGSYQRSKVAAQFFAHLLFGIPPTPEDVCWPMWENGEFSERDKELMHWFRTRPGFARFCMDPAGKQSHTNPGSSFYDIFSTTNGVLRRRVWEVNGRPGDKPKPVYPHYQLIAESGNLVYDRRALLRHFLPATEFSTSRPDLFRATDLQEALRQSKFATPTDKSVAEPKPIHDDSSHLRSAGEYVAYYEYFGWVDPPKKFVRRAIDALRGYDRAA